MLDILIYATILSSPNLSSKDSSIILSYIWFAYGKNDKLSACAVIITILIMLRYKRNKREFSKKFLRKFTLFASLQ